jgi:N-acyl-L-homoserine lactone synthetase
LGGELLKKSIIVAKAEEIDHLIAVITEDNVMMKRTLLKNGFEFTPTEDGKMIQAVLTL